MGDAKECSAKRLHRLSKIWLVKTQVGRLAGQQVNVFIKLAGVLAGHGRVMAGQSMLYAPQVAF